MAENCFLESIFALFWTSLSVRSSNKVFHTGKPINKALSLIHTYEFVQLQHCCPVKWH